jgi:NAD(P)-dependent dehydrogenase (short-subunit alcohol dehydrogenase family)
MRRVPATDLVVIVGAGPGLGRAIGSAFAASGARVVLLARDGDRLARDAADIGAAGYVAVDASNEAELRAAFATIRGTFGDPQVLVHNPSVAYEAPVSQTPLSALMEGFALAAGSLVVAISEVSPAMRRAGRGTILITGGGSALSGSTWSASLAAQKAAVRNLAASAAAELEPDGIKVATVTIDGTLGSNGFDRDDIAAEYVRLHHRSMQADVPWVNEVTWNG